MLVGRDSEVDAVATVVAEHGTVLLAGPAGIGKTSVARAALGMDATWAEGGALETLAWEPGWVELYTDRRRHTMGTQPHPRSHSSVTPALRTLGG